MIGSLAELFGHEGSKVERAAVASDVRGGDYFDGLVKVLDDLEARGVPYRLLFLEAGERRADQPLQGDAPAPPARRRRAASSGAIRVRARRCWRRCKERADVSIDTSDLSASRLRKVVADKMLPRGGVGKLAVTFMTFGFKHGSAARRRPDLRRPLPARTRTTSRSCAT